MLSNLWHIGDRLPLIQMFEDGRFCLCCQCAVRLEKDIFSWKTLLFCGSMESAANRSYKKNFRTILIRPDRNAQHSRSKTTFNGSGSRYLFVNRQTEEWQTGFHHFFILSSQTFLVLCFFFWHPMEACWLGHFINFFLSFWLMCREKNFYSVPSPRQHCEPLSLTLFQKRELVTEQVRKRTRTEQAYLLI